MRFLLRLAVISTLAVISPLAVILMLAVMAGVWAPFLARPIDLKSQPGKRDTDISSFGYMRSLKGLPGDLRKCSTMAL